ncbi:alanine dehydrogenase [Roseibacillus persicicus]|uniref:alanine dehydrogenase n=1 Tax=Roseibacillus persicicus TaxID=454148 RepID=UPI00398BABE8
MKIGIPTEIKSQEHRVSVIPSTVKTLTKRGHEVFVQEGAGIGSSYQDEDYRAAGATLLPDAASVFDAATIIVKVKEPQTSEIALLNESHTLFTYLHLAASKELTEGLMTSGCTAIAYETVSVDRHLPLLEPMSEIAGRMSAMVGSYHLAKHRGGRGILLGGIPGVPPGRVTVIGGGTAGMNAARVANGIGADVTILEVDFDRMRFLDVTMSGAQTLYSSEANLAEILPRTDLVIGAVLVPGAAAPKLITREMLQLLQPGSVLVDIAVDQGGCAETTRPTTHDDPTFFEEDVLHYCVANMPGAYARTATQALNNVTQGYLTLLADRGIEDALRENAPLRSGLSTFQGKLTSKPVAEAHELEFTDPNLVLEG